MTIEITLEEVVRRAVREGDVERLRYELEKSEKLVAYQAAAQTALIVWHREQGAKLAEARLREGDELGRLAERVLCLEKLVAKRADARKPAVAATATPVRGKARKARKARA